VKLLLDENLSPRHAAELRSEGYDACAVTLDADFANVIRFPPENTPGVVRLKVHPPTEQRIREAIRRAMSLLRDIDLAGRLAVVDDTKTRVR